MMCDERDEYGEEPRDLIEGLRRLSQRVQPPADLLLRVIEQGERHWPAHQDGPGGRWTMVWRWSLRPVVWGPAVAALCFIAGMVVSSPQPGNVGRHALTELGQPASEENVEPQVRVHQDVSPPQHVAEMQEPRKQEALIQHTSPLMPPVTLTSLEGASSSMHPSAVPASIEVTTHLPYPIYERLSMEAQQHQKSVPAVVLHAVEIYIRSSQPRD